MIIKRRPGWRSALHDEIEAHRRAPFAYGSRDCGLMVAGCVRAMTGFDPGLGFRGTYRTLGGGKRAIRRAGYADMAALFAEHFEEIAPAFARQGDIVALVDDPGWALGIVAGARVTVMSLAGVGSVDLGRAARGFRVP